MFLVILPKDKRRLLSHLYFRLLLHVNKKYRLHNADSIEALKRLREKALEKRF